MHIFITGGTRGIGNGMVKEFLKRGHQVSFTGTNEKSFVNIIDLEGKYNTYICDVRNIESIEEALKDAISKFGEIDIFINNAGVDQDRALLIDIDSENIKKVIDINVIGMINGTKVALKEMIKQGHGYVYNMEGLGSDDRMIEQTIIYGSSKRLLRYFSNAVNKEMKDYENIVIGTLSPGMVFTDLLLNNSTEESMKIMNILGNTVEEVTPFLVENMLKKKQKIYWLTTWKVIKKFIKSIFVKPKKNG